MAVIYDDELKMRRESPTLCCADRVKIAVCDAVCAALGEAVMVFASAQPQGVSAPAVFVRCGGQTAKKLLGKVWRQSFDLELRYLAKERCDDAESERAAQRLTEAFDDFESALPARIKKSGSARTENGFIMRLTVEADTENAADGDSGGIMRSLELR